MPLLKKVKWIEPSTPIYIEELEAWEKFSGIRIGAGDALNRPQPAAENIFP